MIYAFESIDTYTYGQSSGMDGTEESYIGCFESQEEAFKTFLAYADERMEAEIKGGSKIRNIEIGRDRYVFEYKPVEWYEWINEHHWLFTYGK